MPAFEIFEKKLANLHRTYLQFEKVVQELQERQYSKRLQAQLRSVQKSSQTGLIQARSIYARLNKDERTVFLTSFSRLLEEHHALWKTSEDFGGLPLDQKISILFIIPRVDSPKPLPVSNPFRASRSPSKPFSNRPSRAHSAYSPELSRPESYPHRPNRARSDSSHASRVQPHTSNPFERHNPAHLSPQGVEVQQVLPKVTEYDLDLKQQRRKDIQRIEKDIFVVNEMMMDMNQILQSQQHDIDEIEDHVENAVDNTHEGVKEINKAASYRSAGYGLAIGVGIALAVVGGPIALVAGAGLKAAGGIALGSGIVGGITGKKIQRVVNDDLNTQIDDLVKEENDRKERRRNRKQNGDENFI